MVNRIIKETSGRSIMNTDLNLPFTAGIIKPPAIKNIAGEIPVLIIVIFFAFDKNS